MFYLLLTDVAVITTIRNTYWLYIYIIYEMSFLCYYILSVPFVVFFHVEINFIYSPNVVNLTALMIQ